VPVVVPGRTWRKEHRGQAMNPTLAKLWNVLRKVGMVILIAAVVLLLLAERFHETPFMNFLRTLI
jgi:hypothetical protein